MRALKVSFLLAMCPTPVPCSDCLINSPTYWAQPDSTTQMKTGSAKILTKIVIFCELTQIKAFGLNFQVFLWLVFFKAAKIVIFLH